jgi:L-fuculose-phosphate aldolase
MTASAQEYDDARAGAAAAARRLAETGLVVGTAGNVSVPVAGSDLRAVTATGVVLADCSPADVSVVDPDGAVVAGDLEPTSELELHLLLGGRGAVVHTHAPSSTAVACVLDALPVLHYAQLGLGGEIRVAPYATFGTAELAAGVVAALADRSAALMANHGSVAVGDTLAQAMDNAVLLEWLCALHLRAAALGAPRVLTEDQQIAVIEQALARGYGSTRPAGGDQ